MKSIIVLLASIMMVSACSFQQDPLGGAPAGQPPEYGKPVLEDPIPKEALQIYAPQSFTGRVGEEMSFRLEGRVLVENVSHKIVISNFEDFPGATFDESTGEFAWVPGRDVVAGQPSVTMNLNVMLVTERSEKFPVVSSESKTVSISVVNTYLSPIINKIDNPPGAALRVGYSYTASFEASVPEAKNLEDTFFQFSNCKSSYKKDSIAHLVYYDTYGSKLDANGKLTGNFTIELDKAYNLKTGAYCFAAVAFSKHGLASTPVERVVNIEGRLEDPVLSVGPLPEVKIGDKLTVHFSVFDPRQEGIVAIDRMQDIAQDLPGSSIVCSSSASKKWLLSCTAVIDATTAKVERRYSISLTTSNSSTTSDQKIIRYREFEFSVKAAQ